jgi:hypothetical protein
MTGGKKALPPEIVALASELGGLEATAAELTRVDAELSHVSVVVVALLIGAQATSDVVLEELREYLRKGYEAGDGAPPTGTFTTEEIAASLMPFTQFAQDLTDGNARLAAGKFDRRLLAWAMGLQIADQAKAQSDALFYFAEVMTLGARYRKIGEATAKARREVGSN